MNIHFIAIGGAAMHNLAIALHQKGDDVTGSDDEIFEPSRGRLKKYGLLPEKFGWFPEKITNNLDAVILGMHAKKDNPELLKAEKIGVKIYSYPEYLYEQAKEKKRVVIGGSHGKTSITAMILHVLGKMELNFDYMVGAQLDGFEVMVKLSDAPMMIFEGDEYLTSPLDLRPKFHLYKPHIALISGIAWDHINVFPTFDNYIEQFRIFSKMIEKNGSLIYCKEDKELQKIGENARNDLSIFPYGIPEHKVCNGTTSIFLKGKELELNIFGKHNLMNLEGARLVCEQLGISTTDFYNSISDFGGASNRLELVKKNKTSAIYKDFAHSPSKLKATTMAVNEQFPNRKLIACMELHTYSSLNEKFLSHYDGAMNSADIAIVYFSKHALELKKLPPISVEQVRKGFNNKNLVVFTKSEELQTFLKEINWENKNLLMMSSGNFGGINIKEFADKLLP